MLIQAEFTLHVYTKTHYDNHQPAVYLLQKGGFGAQKVKTNFKELESQAEQRDKEKEQMAANLAIQEAKSKEEQERQL